MNLNNLTPAVGSVKTRKRIGRGTGSGLGGTSTKGPMQGLDIQSEAELYDYVRSLPAKYGCAVLMVSHDLQWVMQGTHRVVCLNKHICCSGLPENVQQHPEYQAIFGTNRVFYQHHHDHCAHGDSATPCQHDARPHIHPEPEA